MLEQIPFCLGTVLVVGGVGISLLVGWLFMKMDRLQPTDANMDLALSILTPYAMYIAAEEAHSSGVLAVVSGGLLQSYNHFRFLSSQSRIRGYNFWSFLSFILNGLDPKKNGCYYVNEQE